MPISSLVLEVAEGDESQVAERLASLPKIDLCAAGCGKLIVTTDTEDVDEDRALTARLATIDGVLSANVVYFNMEDCVDTESPTDQETPSNG